MLWLPLPSPGRQQRGLSSPEDRCSCSPHCELPFQETPPHPTVAPGLHFLVWCRNIPSGNRRNLPLPFTLHHWLSLVTGRDGTQRMAQEDLPLWTKYLLSSKQLLERCIFSAKLLKADNSPPSNQRLTRRGTLPDNNARTWLCHQLPNTGVFYFFSKKFQLLEATH